MTPFIGKITCNISPSAPHSFFITKSENLLILGQDYLLQSVINQSENFIFHKPTNETIKTETSGGRTFTSKFKMPNFDHIALVTTERSRTIKDMFDEVHKRFHMDYDDALTVFVHSDEIQQNEIDVSLELEIKTMLDECVNCPKTRLPRPANPASTSKVNLGFNSVVCHDVFFLDGHPVSHVCDKKTTFSETAAPKNQTIKALTSAFETSWIYRHSSPSVIKFDQAFNRRTYLKMLEFHEIQAGPIPSHAHWKEKAERKHKDIRKFCKRIKISIDFSDVLQKATYISNIAAGNKHLSAFEMIRGYTLMRVLGAALMLVDPSLRKQEARREAKRIRHRMKKAKPDIVGPPLLWHAQ